MSGGPIERRWREGGGDPVEDRMGRLLREVPDPGSLPEARLDRVGAALAAQEAGPPRSRRRARAGRLRWAVMALVLGTSGLVFARREIVRLIERVTGEPAPLPAVAPRAAVAPPRRAAPSMVPVPAAVPAPPAAPLPVPAPVQPVAVTESPPGPAPAANRATPSLAPAPLTAARPAERPRRPVAVASAPAPRSLPVERTAPVELPAVVERTAPVDGTAPVVRPAPVLAPAAPPWSPSPSFPAPTPGQAPAPGLGDEARLVRRALEELRHDRDPAGALDSLDQHRRLFPRGLLRAEADFVRVEALVTLGRDREALVLLAGLDLTQGPRAADLLVTRAELGAARDCAAALADFDRLLARPLPAAIAERGLRGRAVCRLRLGREAEAQADLRAYLARFPQGRFAAEARRRLVPGP